MHFPIITLYDRKPTASELHHTPSGMYEDATIAYNTDYFGEEYTKEQRDELLHSKYLKEFFDGIATVNPGKGTITFLDEDTIRKTLLDYASKQLDALKERLESGRMRFYDFRSAGNDFRGGDYMFWYQYGAFTSGQFIEDTPYYAGKTLYIGVVVDAHC